MRAERQQLCRSETVDLDGHDEVVFGQPAGVVRREGHGQLAPAHLSVGVMTLRLGQQGDLGSQGKGPSEVREREDPAD